MKKEPETKEKSRGWGPSLGWMDQLAIDVLLCPSQNSALSNGLCSSDAG